MKAFLLLIGVSVLGGVSTVALQGDLNGDGQVDHADLFLVSRTWGEVSQSPSSDYAGDYTFWYIDFQQYSTDTHRVDSGKGTFFVQEDGTLTGNVFSEFLQVEVEIEGSVGGDGSVDADVLVTRTKIGRFSGTIDDGCGTGQWEMNLFEGSTGEWMAARDNTGMTKVSY